MCVHSEDEPKYKRKLRLKREMLERLRAEDDAEAGLHVDVSDDFTALNHDHMEMVKSRKSEGLEELSMDSQNIIEEEVSGLDHDHLDIVPKEETAAQKVSQLRQGRGKRRVDSENPKASPVKFVKISQVMIKNLTAVKNVCKTEVF
jgi:hypothetical protein